MTEINTSLPSAPPSGASSSSRPPVTNAQANRLQGLASGINPQQTIDTIIQVERRRLAPIEGRKAETRVELEAFNVVKTGLETLRETATTLAERAIWEGKVVESSDETVVTATATTGAKPGKHTLVVDRLALNHQIASQGYENPDETVGTGNFRITIGEDTTVNVVLDQSNNTLTGLKDAINRATEQVSATIIKTGSRANPYQLVLTSQQTGSDGRISLEIGLKGGETPNFRNSVDEPTDWSGVGPEAPDAPVITGAGASTTIVRVIGDNVAEEDHTFTFTAIQTGVVGSENALQLRWKDETGRSGTLELDSFNYAPGEPIEFADGLSLILSQGEIIVGDKFTVKTRAEKSSLLWWLPESDRASGYAQPSPWNRQATFGAPIIEGPFTGEEDVDFKLTVQGSGQIGTAKDLAIIWETETGDSGIVRVGRGYKPGTKLALTDGITMSLNPGVLNEGSTSSFTAIASATSTRWWLDDAQRSIPAAIESISNFSPPPEKEEKEQFGIQPDFPEELGPRKSAVDRQVTGVFEGDEAKVYTFRASQNGTMGTTKGLVIRWEDDKGNAGSIDVGEDYEIGTPLPFDSGLSISFGSGRVFEGDSFTVRTRTSTIQPAQDALIRFGATELGGGLEITNTTNELEDVIEGVKLNLVSISEKPVTITISGETEKAVETIIQFANDFNQLALLVNELTKFDKETGEAGPLLGDRDLIQIRDGLTRMAIDPVAGLPKSLNMLFALGLKLDDKGVLAVDEETLRSKIGDDFAAVADVFRNKGESDNSNVVFINMSDDTLANPDGLAVEITRNATQGRYETPMLQAPVMIQEGNNKVIIAVDGTQSEPITIDPGVYTLEAYARQLQNKITDDEAVGKRGVRVTAEEGRITVSSGRYGSRGTIEFSATPAQPVLPPGLEGGITQPGVDVEGSIGGEQAEGIGRLLRGGDDSKAIKGLRLLVDLSDEQLQPEGPEATLKLTKGVGAKTGLHIKELLDPINGNLPRITNNLRTQVDDIDAQLEQLNERIESKRARLQERFTRLESQMSQLKSQQSFMSSQLGGLPSPGGAAAALPGL